MRIAMLLLVASCATPAAGSTHYVFGGEGSGGGYDCSGWVNHVLSERAPRAYASVERLRPRPRVREYIEAILAGDEGWRRIDRVADLQPGDVVALSHPKEQRATGHIMIVVAPPRKDPVDPDVYQLRVEDAARSGHADDTRPEGASGVGEGTVLLGADPTGAPQRFAWSLRRRWQEAGIIAMGRPR